MKLFIDNYYWIAGLLTLGVAGWTGFVAFVLGIGLIVRTVLK
jgi:hypothetical protein